MGIKLEQPSYSIVHNCLSVGGGIDSISAMNRAWSSWILLIRFWKSSSFMD
jgi:hypothetical protein